MKDVGFEKIGFEFRTHFFGTIAYQTWIRIPRHRKFLKFFTALAHLDYLLFRKLPNAASMLGVARKKVE